MIKTTSTEEANSSRIEDEREGNVIGSDGQED
jgi:hypothetical protein